MTELNRGSISLPVADTQPSARCLPLSPISVFQRSFKVSMDRSVCIQAMAYSRQGIVAVALKSDAILKCEIKLFHHSTLKPLADIDVFPAVSQKLSKCDGIIKQHKTGTHQP